MSYLRPLVLLTVAYAAVAALGLQWPVIGGMGPPIWPAAGLGLAGLVLGGLRLWPAVFIGRFLASALAGAELGLPAELAIAAWNTLATLAAAAWLRRLSFDKTLSTTRGVLLLVGGAGLLALLAGGTGTAALTAFGPPTPPGVFVLFRDWWIASFLGAVLTAPLILAWRRQEVGAPGGLFSPHFLVMAVTACALAYAVFLLPDAVHFNTWLSFPILIWAALAFGVAGAAFAAAVIGAAAVAGTSLGISPFSLASGSVAPLFLSQQFAAMASVTTLILASASEERQGKEALARSEARLKAVLRAAELGSWHWTLATGRVDFNDRWAAMLGYDLSELPADYDTFARLCHPEDLAVAETCLRDYFSGQAPLYSVEIRMRHKKGHWVWVLATGGVAERNEDGTPAVLTGTHQDITERVKEREALRVSEARLRSTLDQLFTFVGLLSPEGIVQFANKAPLQAAGIRFEDVNGQPFEKTFWWSFDEAVQRRLRAAMDRAAKGETLRFDTPVRMANGRIMTIDFQIGPMFGPDGEVMGLIPSAVDIEDRVAAFAALEASEQSLRLALEAAKAGTFQMWPSSARPPYVSSGTKRLFGFEETEEPSLEDYLLRIHPDDRERIDEAVTQSFKTVSGHYVEYRTVTPEGRVRWVGSRAEAAENEEGRTECLRGAVIDLSEQKAAEAERERLLAEVQRSGALITAITESSTDPIYAKDKEGRMLLANPATLEAVGKTAEEVLGRKDDEWANDPREARIMMENDRRVMTHGKAEHIEEGLATAAGHRVFLSTKAPLRDASGEVIGLVGISTDITERKASEERLRLLNRELNHRVKNLFAVMRGLVTMSAIGEEDATRLADKLCERIEALAAAHLVSMDDEQLNPVPFCEVLKAVVAPYEHDRRRLEFDGPAVEIPRRFVTPLGLILHELATNAVKYGAWAEDDGRIDVRWAVSDGAGTAPVLRLEWRECAAGLSPPAEEATRRGFGSRLMRSSATQIGGGFVQEWRKDGLCTVLTLPAGENGVRPLASEKTALAEETDR